jgi:hypothetical protein
MKSVLQIAKDIGVSKQAVYKRFKGRLYTDVLPYVHTKQGTVYISEQGETIIKQDFKGNMGISEEVHTECIRDTVTDTVMDTLVLMLKKELEEKNRQIEELTATIRIQAETMRALQHNELAGTIIEGNRSANKTGIFKRLLNGFKRNSI